MAGGEGGPGVGGVGGPAADKGENPVGETPTTHPLEIVAGAVGADPEVPSSQSQLLALAQQVLVLSKRI